MPTIILLYLDINECSPNPCLNSASCIDGVNSYTCKCLAGFVGKHCETGEYTDQPMNQQC